MNARKLVIVAAVVVVLALVTPVAYAYIAETINSGNNSHTDPMTILVKDNNGELMEVALPQPDKSKITAATPNGPWSFNDAYSKKVTGYIYAQCPDDTGKMRVWIDMKDSRSWSVIDRIIFNVYGDDLSHGSVKFKCTNTNVQTLTLKVKAEVINTHYIISANSLNKNPGYTITGLGTCSAAVTASYSNGEITFQCSDTEVNEINVLVRSNSANKERMLYAHTGYTITDAIAGSDNITVVAHDSNVRVLEKNTKVIHQYTLFGSDSELLEVGGEPNRIELPIDTTPEGWASGEKDWDGKRFDIDVSYRTEVDTNPLILGDDLLVSTVCFVAAENEPIPSLSVRYYLGYKDGGTVKDRNANDALISKVYVYQGNIINPPTAPKGFSIAGWYYEKDGNGIGTGTEWLFAENHIDPRVGKYPGTKWNDSRTELELYAKYNVIDYNVAFNWDGLTIESSSQVWDRTYTVLSPSFGYSNEKSTGVPWVDSTGKYSLNSWTGSGISGKSKSITIPQGSTGDRSYTAVWTYDVTFNANGGTGTMEKQTITRGELTSLTKVNGLTPPTGKSFYGWNTELNGTGKMYMDGEEVLNLGNTTLYAIWKDKKTITFSANGGSGAMSPQVVWNGVSTPLNKNSFTAPSDQKLFYKWDTSSSGAGQFADEGAIEVIADTTLYAIWKDKVTITFDANGGTGAMAPQEICSGVSTPLNKNSLIAPEWMIFGSWNTVSGGTGISYADGESISKDANTTLYAIWVPKATIAFNPNGGTGTMTNQDCIKDQPNNLKPNEFTRSGWTFYKWDTSPTGPGSISDKGSYTPTANITLYAIWTCNVNYMPNGGTSTMVPDVIYSNNVQDTIKQNGFTPPANMHFYIWNTKADGTGTDYSPASVINVTGELTLYAIWGYEVIFDSNGGTGTMDNQIIPRGIATELRANVFTPTSGHAFYGWNTDGTSKERIYTDGEKVTITADTTLKAIWGCSVTFDLNVCPSGFEAPDTEVVKDGGKVVEPDMGLDAYRVTWYTDKATTSAYNFNTPVTGNIVLYAKWEIQLFLIYNALTGPDKRDDSIWVPYGEPAYIKFSYDSSLEEAERPWGWNTNSMGRGAYFNYNTQYTISYPGAFFAIWHDPGTAPYFPLERYFITFCSNGGSGYMDKQVVPKAVAEHSTITINAIDNSHFYREGWVFDHWNTRADGSGTSYTDEQSGVTITDNITLFAIWKHKVAYDKNGATAGDAPAGDNYVDGATVTVANKPDSLVKSGYYFVGWNTKADGSGAFYYGGNTFTITENVTLYAIWGHHVTSVLLDSDSVNLTVGGTKQLVATIAPSDAFNKNVTWSISDGSVATVSDAGLITAVAGGSATITVTTEDGGYTATCTVTVSQS